MDDAGMSAGSTPPPSDSSRYAYLVARLRNKQITMSEATELFEMQQATLASALASAGRTPPPPPPPDYAAGTTAAPAVTPPTGGRGPSDDMFWMGMLAVGAGAGVLAALLRRNQSPAAPTPSAATGAKPRAP